jgi:hypothetical protein
VQTFKSICLCFHSLGRSLGHRHRFSHVGLSGGLEFHTADKTVEGELMHVHYTTVPTFKSDTYNRVHWLISLAEGLRYMDSSDDVLWVKRDKTDDGSVFLLRLPRTKMSAQLHENEGKIEVKILQQVDVDPTKIFMPRGVQRSNASFGMDNEGLRLCVQFLLQNLTHETIYSQGENKRIQLALMPQLDAAPPVFFGGIISKVELTQASVVDHNEGVIRDAQLIIEDDDKHIATIHVGKIGLLFHPEKYAPSTRAMASMYVGDFHERVYTFSRDSLASYYQLH